MTQFNVGDKVRVREDLKVGNRYNGTCLFTSDMDEHRGKIFSIKSVDFEYKRYKLNTDDDWNYSDEMLEPAEYDCYNCGNKGLIEFCEQCLTNANDKPPIPSFWKEKSEEKSCNNCAKYGLNLKICDDCYGQNNLQHWELKEEIKVVSDYDIINKPSHYNQYRVEVIDIIEDATKELKGMEAVNLGHIIRYVLRYQFKNGVQDLKKAQFYLDKQIKLLEGNDESNNTR